MTKKVKKKRSNAGRHPAADPKLKVVLFIETSKIDARGGMDKIKKYLYEQA